MYDDPGRDIGPKSRDLWKPVIAAVQGIACGGAFYMLGQTEFIIASDDATFFDPHVTYGMTAAFEPIEMLSKMPLPEVMRMSLMGAHERMSAERAREIGLVTEVVPRDDLLERAAWVARVIADSPAAGHPGHDAGPVDRARDAPQPGRGHGQPLHPDRIRRGGVPGGPGPLRLRSAGGVAAAVTDGDDLGTNALRFEREGSIAWCTIDRPAARNALTPAMYYGIKRAVWHVNQDPDLAALIITGTDDVFAPGGDLGVATKNPSRGSVPGSLSLLAVPRKCS